MQRDYSPTYWFRVQRAEQLLALYQEDPAAFRELAEEYQNPIHPKRRAARPFDGLAEIARCFLPVARRSSFRLRRRPCQSIG